ncbi:MAG: TA system VapC family ribonuclease toxin [Myxococcota bacterium]
MIALDTNILVYAHRAESPFHQRAAQVVRDLAESLAPWAIPWPCLHEFLSVVTNPRIFRTPTSGEKAFAQVRAWLESPTLVLLGEGPGYVEILTELVLRQHIVGPQVHDARVAALVKLHGVTELLSADRDFSRFPIIRVRNPL